jgi:hypothetical protein
MQDDIFLKKHEIFERKVMNMLLAGELKLLAKLRKQYEIAIVKDREFNGYGFFTDFEVPDESLRVAYGEKKYASLHMGDVLIDYDGQEGAYGVILFVDDGFIDCLEGHPFISHEWIDDYDKIDDMYYEETPNGKLYERDASRLEEIGQKIPTDLL